MTILGWALAFCAGAVVRADEGSNPHHPAGATRPDRSSNTTATAPIADPFYQFSPETGELEPVSPLSTLGGFPTPGPDIIVGVVANTAQYGREGPIGFGTVGLAMRTESCNQGDVPYHWFELPDVDHPMIAMNLYRLRVVSNSQRFEQIGYSWIKHAFSVFEGNACGFGCQSSGTSTMLGVGCSDPYSSTLNAGQCGLGPRGLANPYTGAIPGGDNLAGSPCAALNFPARDHRDHVHNGISHRLQVSDVDLIPLKNPGARYFAEAQYIGPDEFNDPDALANQNMHNNVSYREVAVTGPNEDGVFTFSDVGDTMRESPALTTWEGATIVTVEPAPGEDGRAFVAYRSAPLDGGTRWHHEYAIYNMNLDRAIGSFRVPLSTGAMVTNVGFHAPRHHAPEAHAPTYPNTPWAVAVTGEAVTWSTDPFSVDPDANAIRWGTLYNFRFDTDLPPEEVTVTLGMFKTQDTVDVVIPVEQPECFVPADCDDGVACNGEELCVDGTCQPAPFDDCNGNGAPDPCDVEDGTSTDGNGNGVPDECEDLGDYDEDGDVDLFDYESYLNCVAFYDGVDPAQCAVFDFDGDLDVDFHDLAGFQRVFTGEPSCPIIVGAGTNPGPGSGDIVEVTVFVPGIVATVVIHPCLPFVGCVKIMLNAGVKGQITFACADQITFGEVIFLDHVNPPINVGEVTFDRGTDFACGAPLTVVFTLPCNITLLQE